MTHPHWPIGVVTCGRQYLLDTLHGLGRSLCEPLVFYDTVGHGVWAASNDAICSLFAQSRNAPGVVLLQDDVEVDRYWPSKLAASVGQAPRDVGLIAGLTAVHRRLDRPPGLYEECNVTAQMLYISRAFFDGTPFFRTPARRRDCYDSAICAAAREAGFRVALVQPYLARHIGRESSVRPGQLWEVDSRPHGFDEP